jgi:V/A-type H+-transporting ATPase subunit E
MSTRKTPETVSRGVQELIDEIRDKGVKAGREESAKIVADAEARAQWIVQQAKDEAERVRGKAEQESNFIRESGREALQLAMRDVLLRLRDELSRHLTHELRVVMEQKLQQEDALQALLKGIAARIAGESVPETLLIPASVVGVDALKEQPEALTEGMLPALLADLLQQLMARGVTVLATAEQSNGCRLVYENGTISVDLSDQVLTSVLMAHLQPRFRAILEGVVA